MTENKTAASAANGQSSSVEAAAVPVKTRRVGTFTFGVALVATGLWMLAALFFPELDTTLLLKLSPVFLILLGVEVLLSTRHGGKLKYDWLGMVFCFLVVCGALCVFAFAWAMIKYPEYYHW